MTVWHWDESKPNSSHRRNACTHTWRLCSELAWFWVKRVCLKLGVTRHVTRLLEWHTGRALWESFPVYQSPFINPAPILSAVADGASQALALFVFLTGGKQSEDDVMRKRFTSLMASISAGLRRRPSLTDRRSTITAADIHFTCTIKEVIGCPFSTSWYDSLGS